MSELTPPGSNAHMTPAQIKKYMKKMYRGGAEEETDSKDTSETKYEIFDSYGVIVKKGTNTVIDCGNLKKGVYYINYDNINDKFIKIGN